MKRTLPALVALIALVIVALFFLKDGDTPKESPLQALAVGKMAKFTPKAPPTRLSDLPFTSPSGEQITLSSFEGKVILLNVWATWCAPCRHEMPDLEALNQEMQSDDFQVVILSMDRGGREASQKFLDEIGVTSLEPYLDPTGKFSRSIGVLGLPVTILINERGEELGRLVGPAEWSSPDARSLIEHVLTP
ncbi:TlpA disulfide reductase family protein [Emcibacter sp.]|uniref:TlpA family protein disulfide reductase n=1 Tax=Emcibacter sp. TaxID=1979954 RepID=UPI002AA7DC48|nr:TlpA disulfide reductase family protein [Emcibacter sp.]